MKLSLQWKWFLGLAGLLAVLLAAVNVAIDATLPAYLLTRVRADLVRDVHLTAAAVAQARLAGQDLEPLAGQWSAATGLRVTIIRADGTVIAESGRPADALGLIENHIGRPEVREALSHGLGFDVRRSETIHTELLYAAVPDGAGGVVRVALPLHSVRDTTRRVTRTVAAASGLVALLALPIVFVLARLVTNPIDRMRIMAGQAAGGDFSLRAPTQGGAELCDLGLALNRMSDQLHQRLIELADEKAELQATLATMVEGVLVVDAESRVRLANASLARHFGIDPQHLGRTVMETLRNVNLQGLIDQVLSDRPTSSQEMSFFGDEERVFDVTAARLGNGGGRARGAVVVFHDITRIKSLERVRREFVANASHELRTPLSVIRGYVETLLEDPPPGAEDAHRFLETMDRHVRRLETLLKDLLSISELESQQARLNFETVPLRDLAADAASELERLAASREITVSLEFPEALPSARADAQRLHQVFTNLMDNAIKYTASGGWVRVTAEARPGELVVRVSDSGPGIAAEHLTRIFERFYRVDRARSRELGGTGLGLSIVKHIVQAHGGRVWAESKVGEGSSFFFTVPQA